MELVRGIKITDYCDQERLSTRDRLDLFIKVCQAIQHAHQKGIIHRDIKPSNILVTLHDGVPVPKVIDFGIAKAVEGRLTDATVYTRLHQFIGTPAYMSPEQAEMSGLDIETRSDIRFDVRGLIVAPPDDPRWRRWRFYATPVEPIRIQRPVSRLHFLHATTFRAPERAVIGRYLLHFADGDTQVLPLVYGVNVRRWHQSSDEPATIPDAETAWRGTNPTAGFFGTSLRLCRWTWTNPEPAQAVQTLELQGATGLDTAPFVVALTVE